MSRLAKPCKYSNRSTSAAFGDFCATAEPSRINQPMAEFVALISVRHDVGGYPRLHRRRHIFRAPSGTISCNNEPPPGPVNFSVLRGNCVHESEGFARDVPQPDWFRSSPLHPFCRPALA